MHLRSALAVIIHSLVLTAEAEHEVWPAQNIDSSSLIAGSSASGVVVSFPQPVLQGTITGLRYTGVGGNGTYGQVTHMNPGTPPSCNVQSCTEQTVSVSGSLAPFQDQMTFVFRSMNVHSIAVYQPQGGSADADLWELTSSFASGQPMQNMVWMNNMGSDQTSGEWDICNGASQSFAGPSFINSTKSPAGVYSGVIPPGYEANIMTSTLCSAGSCPDFSRGAAMEGWAGSKLMITEFTMPMTSPSQPPAIWGLNSQAVRSAQYGCNCRGEGSDGGCGELDIFQVLTNASANEGFSQLYSFKGATGSGNAHFARPTASNVTYATLLDVQTDTISILQLDSFAFGTQAVPRSIIDQFVSAQAMTIFFGAS